MRITSVHLKNYKRFTDLHITDIPQSARLVVMVGPNGSGKSSVFDAFLLKSHSQRNNSALSDGIYGGYLLKDETADAHPSSTREVANSVDIDLDREVNEWSRVFNIRSPYRHEADFANTNLGPVKPAYASSRFQRIIDQDQAVSDNFNRLGRSALHGALSSEPEDKSLGQFRKDALGEIKLTLEKLFDEPVLSLQDLGAGIDSGAFRFRKGSIGDFHYKNLSGGEKAAFDLLLDVFVKRSEYTDAIYCIDEPEAHVASAIHGRLLEALLGLVPDESQLWIATHSTGFVRKAVELSMNNNCVAFLDFSGHDFDTPVTLSPTIPNQSFFRKMYDVLQSDLAGLVAPACIILCEGSEGTDAKIYNRVFEESHPETLFIPRGGSNSIEKSDIVSVLEAVIPKVRVWRLIDRDDMPDSTREEKIGSGIHVLRRREIENYLWDESVVRKALQNIGAEDTVIDGILEAYPFPNPGTDDMKMGNQQQFFFERIRKAEGLSLPGRNPKEFASAHLAWALLETEEVYQELHEDVFSQPSRISE